MRATDQVAMGHSGVMLSRLGIGGGSLTNEGGAEAVEALLTACWEAGLRYFDTAPLYADGVSEQRFGDFFQAKPRDAFTVSTKVGRFPAPAGQRRFDYSRDATLRSIEGSLDRLKIDRIDIVFIHDLDAAMHNENLDAQFATALDQCYPALAELQSEGVVGAIGLSTRQPDICMSFARHVPVTAFMMAGAYTLLNHAPLNGMFSFCEERDIAIIAASPFNSGILATGRPDSMFDYASPCPEIVRRVTAIAEVCQRHSVPLPVAALQFALYHPQVPSVVVGHRDKAELDANLAAIDATIPDALWLELKAVKLLPQDAPLPGSGRDRDDVAQAQISRR